MRLPCDPRDARSRRESGQSLVESALVIPLILLMFMGTVDVGRIVFAYIALEEAVQEGATYASHAAGTPGWGGMTIARVTSSSNHVEVASAVVADPSIGTACTAPPAETPGRITVSATYDLPLLTPVGSVLFGGTFRLGASVVATNLEGKCDP
jgi:Flp pilus assembly protein TadG